tara:strand:- start:385 stop:903 length:519 start_codon:yes stop_codon:yes gene_type:complete
MVSVDKSFEKDVLPDMLDFNLRLVFCGSAPSPISAIQHAYYAGPGNRFWDVLWEVGIIPEKIVPSQFLSVIKYGVGLTDLAKGVTGVDADIPKSCYEKEKLRKKISIFRPRWCAFNGKRPAQEFLNRSVEYGIQRERIFKTRIFVLPSTSGAARRFWEKKHWEDLSKLLLPV